MMVADELLVLGLGGGGGGGGCGMASSSSSFRVVVENNNARAGERIITAASGWSRCQKQLQRRWFGAVCRIMMYRPWRLSAFPAIEQSTILYRSIFYGGVRDAGNH